METLGVRNVWNDQEELPFTNMAVWVNLWSSFVQLNLGFAVVTELALVLMNRWWWSVRPAALLTWTDIKNKPSWGNFNLHCSGFLPDHLVVCPDHRNQLRRQQCPPPPPPLQHWFGGFFCLWNLCEYNSASLRQQSTQQSIHVMSDSAISTYLHVEQCSLRFRYIPFVMLRFLSDN